jgi:hypothetical protein
MKDPTSEKILALARALPSDDHVPYGFEKRVMARLTDQTLPDVWAVWSRSLWFAAAPCVGLMILVTVWSAVTSRSANSKEALAADFEQIVWGPLNAIGESW